MLAEFTAFRERLAAHQLLIGKVETAVRLSKGNEPVRANYVIAFPAAPDIVADNRYTAAPDPDADARYTWDVRVVGVDADGVMLLADAVKDQLVGHTLTVPGRRCEPIEYVEPVEEGWGRDNTLRLEWVDMSFRFWSRRV